MRSTNNEHATCPTCLAVLPTDPYRSNYILPQKTHNMFLSKVSAKFITLSERFPKAIKTIKSIPSMVLYFVIGSIAISGTIAGVSALVGSCFQVYIESDFTLVIMYLDKELFCLVMLLQSH